MKYAYVTSFTKNFCGLIFVRL